MPAALGGHVRSAIEQILTVGWAACRPAVNDRHPSSTCRSGHPIIGEGSL